MKKAVFIVLFLFPSLYSLAQDDKLSVGLVGGVISNKYDFTFTDPSYEYKAYTGYTLGVGIEYKTCDKLFLTSGLEYSRQGYNVKYNFNFSEPGDPFIPRKSKLHVYHLWLPLFIGYQVVDIGNFKLKPQLGINTGLQVKHIERTIFENGSERASEFINNDLNKVQFQAVGQLSFEYHLKNKIFFKLIPFIGKSLNNLNEDFMKSAQTSYGGRIGVHYKL